MAITLSSLATNTAKVEVEFGGQTATLVYKPSMVTQKTLEEATENPDAHFLVKAVTSWDVMLTPKKKVPLTIEGLSTVPKVFLSKCVLAILNDRGESVGEASKP